MEKVDNMKKQMDNISRKIKTEKSKRNVSNQNIVKSIKNALNGRLDMAEERLNELKGKSLETSRTEMQIEKRMKNMLQIAIHSTILDLYMLMS